MDLPENAAPREHGTTRLKVATYNLHQWIGRDRRVDIQRILSVIRSLDADLIALQEVLLPWAGFTQDDLARETGMQVIPGRTLYRGDAEYGNALLTSLPVRRAWSMDLTVPPFEPRGAICASLLVGCAAVKVVATHLGMRHRERLYQMEALMRELMMPAELTVMLGDINEWVPRSPVLGRLRAVFGYHQAPKTFPSRFPLLALDRILASPPVFERLPCVVRTGAARMASDHLPLNASLRV
ncbi:MAG: endonuclease/exonuclease/phosphatase family protein [Deltaproteobacteria bacterium]|nr:endonuclease/exonuclease/phosphatase family protein [Deltaproteobacteria bacterium]